MFASRLALLQVSTHSCLLVITPRGSLSLGFIRRHRGAIIIIIIILFVTFFLSSLSLFQFRGEEGGREGSEEGRKGLVVSKSSRHCARNGMNPYCKWLNISSFCRRRYCDLGLETDLLKIEFDGTQCSFFISLSLSPSPFKEDECIVPFALEKMKKEIFDK